MSIEEILLGPVAFDTETRYSTSVNFLKGCSYSVSMWTWLWPTRDYDVNIIRIKPLDLLSSQFINASRVLFPTIIINLPRNPSEYFISVGLDNEGVPTGFFSGPKHTVQYLKWLHIAMTITDSGYYRAFINGEMVGQWLIPGMGTPLDKACHRSDMDSGIFQVFSHQNRKSAVGIVEHVMIHKGKALDGNELKALMNQYPHTEFPTLNWFIDKYFHFSNDSNIEHAISSAVMNVMTPRESGIIALPMDIDPHLGLISPPLHKRLHYSGRNLSSLSSQLNANKTLLDMLNNYNMEVMDELHRYVLLWSNGRHQDISNDLLLPLHQWKELYYERTESALIVNMFISDDFYYSNQNLKYDVRWGAPYTSHESVTSHIKLGYRYGFDMRDGVRVLDNEELMQFVQQMSNDFAPIASNVTGKAVTIADHALAEAIVTLSNLLDDTDYFRHNYINNSNECIDQGSCLATITNPAVELVTTDSHQPAAKENQCNVALLYYYTVAQYTASHFSVYEAGIKPLERVRVTRNRELQGQGGVDDALYVIKIMEADAGDAQADVWLAKAYYFGYNGLERNANEAIRYD